MLAPSDLLARYVDVRGPSGLLQFALMRRLPHEVIEEGRRDLGLPRGEETMFDEPAVSLLLEYCIFHVRRDGRNAVQSFLAEDSFPEESADKLLLQSMAQSWYSLFSIQEIIVDTGAVVRDVLRGGEHVYAEATLSRTKKAGNTFAVQAIPCDGFIMANTAGLYLGVEGMTKERVMHALERLAFQEDLSSFKGLSAEQEREVARTIIVNALARRTPRASLVRGEPNPRGIFGHRPHSVAVQTRGRIGRNEPCPCGSGKKFKKCCGG